MMIVQYLSEYITAKNGDAKKIAEFEERYGYTPKPFLRDGIKDARYYQLSNYYPDEDSRFIAAVRLFAVVFHEPKVAPPRGKQREVIKQWLVWLSGRQGYTDVEELVDLCKKETGVGSDDTINSIINQTTELTNWRDIRSVQTKARTDADAAATTAEIGAIVETATTNATAATKVIDTELLDNFKNDELYRAANAKDKRAMKKAFANMTDEERVLYFVVDENAG